MNQADQKVISFRYKPFEMTLPTFPLDYQEEPAYDIDLEEDFPRIERSVLNLVRNAQNYGNPPELPPQQQNDFPQDVDNRSDTSELSDPPDMDDDPEVQDEVRQLRRNRERNQGLRRSTRVRTRPRFFHEEFAFLLQSHDFIDETFNILEARGDLDPIFKDIANATATVSNRPKDPASYAEATSDPTYGAAWKQAIQTEIDAFIRNKVWIFTPKPKGRRPITCKWVFTYKTLPSGEVDRCKARCVARGHTQKEGIDYHETFAAVAKMDSIRLIFSHAVIHDLHIHQMDVVNAFLLADIDEDIISEVPQGVSVPGGGNPKEFVIRIVKSMYGLKQAGRNWYLKLHNALVSLDFHRCETDHAVYIHPESGLILAFWVDDIMILHHSEDTINSLKAIMAKEFEMKDLGPMRHFLGLAIIRRHNRLFISQQHYVDKIIESYEKETLRKLFPVDIPIKPNTNLVPNEGPPYKQALYQKYLGSVMYAMLGTRPDIAYTVQRLSQFCSNPSEQHHQALEHLIKYLLRTKYHGLTYCKDDSPIGPSSNLKHFIRQTHESENERTTRIRTEDLSAISGFSDADWASGYDRRSVGGNLFFHHSNLISWSSKKIQLVATSTLEAEYAALSLASRQAIWLRKLDAEISQEEEKTIQMYCDNQSALKVAKNPEAHARTKHFDIHLHFVRQRVELGHIRVDYLNTKQMPADFLTKALPRPAFEECRLACGVCPIPLDLLNRNDQKE